MRTATLKLEIEVLEDGSYMATAPEIRSLVAWGETMQDAIENAGHVARALLASFRDHGDPVPAALAALEAGDETPKKIEVLLPVEAA